MTILTWLLGLAYPHCRATGAEGIDLPPPIAMDRIERGTKPNNALAGPAGKRRQAVDLLTEPVPMAPRRLYDAARSAIAFQPRTWVLAEYPDRLQLHAVARSAICNFPDLVSVQVERGIRDDEALLTLWSRSIHGYHDLGANRRRLRAWIAEIACDARAYRNKHDG